VARIRLDRAALNRTIRQASRLELEEAGRQTLARARVLAPVDTGRLRASLRMQFSRTFTLRPRVTIGSDVAYAAFVNDGTRPHVIRPRRRGGRLRFVAGDRVVYARQVQHPGTRARPFLDRALREVIASRERYRLRIE
jgi:phage gpG-like protein